MAPCHKWGGWRLEGELERDPCTNLRGQAAAGSRCAAVSPPSRPLASPTSTLLGEHQGAVDKYLKPAGGLRRALAAERERRPREAGGHRRLQLPEAPLVACMEAEERRIVSCVAPPGRRRWQRGWVGGGVAAAAVARGAEAAPSPPPQAPQYSTCTATGLGAMVSEVGSKVERCGCLVAAAQLETRPEVIVMRWRSRQRLPCRRQAAGDGRARKMAQLPPVLSWLMLYMPCAHHITLYMPLLRNACKMNCTVGILPRAFRATRCGTAAVPPVCLEESSGPRPRSAACSQDACGSGCPAPRSTVARAAAAALYWPRCSRRRR